jgi:hypothetical protein
MPTTPEGWRELFAEAHALVPVPRRKIVYRVTLGGGVAAPVVMWEWRCPVCPYLRRDRDRKALEAEVNFHRCRARESLRWHPRYRMPPRWKR